MFDLCTRKICECVPVLRYKNMALLAIRACWLRMLCDSSSRTDHLHCSWRVQKVLFTNEKVLFSSSSREIMDATILGFFTLEQDTV